MKRKKCGRTTKDYRMHFAHYRRKGQHITIGDGEQWPRTGSEMLNDCASVVVLALHWFPI
ncbi:hypothetical protein BLOT_014848 [Blomia tropicalis]|nr:hypothetical protein BLOT_014848 [Blomia tropicalis]